MYTPQPGDLDQRITIQAEAPTADGYGGSVLAWSTVATVWAKAWPVSGKERTQAQQIEAAAMHRFLIRYRDDVTEGMRIVWQGRAHNIRFVARPSSRKLYMQIDAEAGVAV